jgi:hypothetical protein
MSFTRRFFTDPAFQSSVVRKNPEADLLSFFSAVQDLQIEILPLTWQDGDAGIAGGATSRINMLPVDLQTSLVFKCVSDKQKRTYAAGIIFQTLIFEIEVLHDRLLRKHPNIMNLQAVCWDIPSSDHVWPALVFEMSPYGDLYSFAQVPAGRDISVVDRLKLCIEAGKAIIDMNSLGRKHSLLFVAR